MMKIREMIKRLERIKDYVGDVECLIAVSGDDGIPNLMPVDEILYDDRDGYGKSVIFLE